MRNGEGKGREGKERKGTCIVASRLGFLGISILLNPIPIAPEETMITRCPSLRRRTEVSTIRDKFDKSGS